MILKNYRCAKISQVVPADITLKRAIETDKSSTIPSALQKCYETGRIDAFKLNWKEGMPNKPHIYWDSDVAKWMEGAAYALALEPNPVLEAQVDEVIEKNTAVSEFLGKTYDQTQIGFNHAVAQFIQIFAQRRYHHCFSTKFLRGHKKTSAEKFLTLNIIF